MPSGVVRDFWSGEVGPLFRMLGTEVADILMCVQAEGGKDSL